ncbi:MAG: glycosyltransferase [Chloroflexi bacterium]|nr:glycosyltransferase [Chloroflexota bacterium]
MKLAYITVSSPFGNIENFFLPEMLELRKHTNLLIAPLRPGDSIPNPEAVALGPHCHRISLLHPMVILRSLLFLIMHPIVVLILSARLIRYSRSIRIALKNFAVLPKGIYLAKVFSDYGIDHIHSHWGSTPSTCAYIASTISRIPWSLTFHRWDIIENNMLREKIRSCKFARVISDHGKDGILNIIGREYEEKLYVIHMGVNLLNGTHSDPSNPTVPTIGCVASFIKRKGHRYLLEACRILMDRGLCFKCLLVGSGPELPNIRDMANSLGLEDILEYRIDLPHEEVLNMFTTHSIQVLALPSINLEDEPAEGIPVVLMEALAQKVPVVATSVGGVPELLGSLNGFLVPERNAEALAIAIGSMLKNPENYTKSVNIGFKAVMEEFNVEVTTRKFFRLISR